MISQLREALTASLDISSTISWFRNVYFPEILKRINSDDSRKRMALYEGERLRTNERNLTDTRTRLGQLLEHELTRISNDLLADEHIDDLFWTYVVANRFPDLEIHSNDGTTHMRIEMKALEGRAEEKSANFATLIKDINPYTDYLVVFLWEWDDSKSEYIAWDSAVRVRSIYVFHAYSLARIRDYYWLNNPPRNCKAYQGIDLRTAINCNAEHFSIEEHNMGKILRLWPASPDSLPASFSPLEQATLRSYIDFTKEVYSVGFEYLAKTILSELGASPITKTDAGFFSAYNVLVVPHGSASSRAKRLAAVQHTQTNILVQLGNNYRCSSWYIDLVQPDHVETKLFDNTKPKNAAAKIKSSGYL